MTQTHNEIKKDCERKAKLLVSHFRGIGPIVINYDSLEKMVSELILSEHLIVQKRVEELEKELSEHKNCTLDGDCPVCDYNAVQIMLEDKQKQIDELTK